MIFRSLVVLHILEFKVFKAGVLKTSSLDMMKMRMCRFQVYLKINVSG